MADNTEARPTTNGSNGDSGGGGADSDDEQVSVVKNFLVCVCIILDLCGFYPI